MECHGALVCRANLLRSEGLVAMNIGRNLKANIDEVIGVV